MDKELRMEPF
ncbi:hypothetical protein CGLO_18122 [Colletotrichum gloeosporioides Cg-14]|uniref:Uncharacterized protein n=1 Tax=Colletotrichum gloeosporioides (strain Cg-14) TaxID=1237896 RepID=T0JIN0_COLGC|nr:hypothetical protein CGLO_18122 [Colletotrichum gloeosporioides Cg-14]